MKRRPNYAQERAEQKRRKQAKRDERVQAKAERSQKARLDETGTGAPANGLADDTEPS